MAHKFLGKTKMNMFRWAACLNYDTIPTVAHITEVLKVSMINIPQNYKVIEL